MIHTTSFRRHLLMFTLATGFLLPHPASADSAPAGPERDAAQVVLAYATALVQSDVAHWAAADLTCMSRAKSTPDAP
ncbi:MAG: hypothetical protein OEY86_14940, partial [Nitrospira sp.]|nr:hypothetical protein [Nitrospira sp.]